MTKLYSIKDAKIGFNQVFQGTNKFEALRAFSEAVNNKQSLYNKFVNDFALYELGELDEQSGAITSEIKFIEEGSNLIKKDE